MACPVLGNATMQSILKHRMKESWDDARELLRDFAQSKLRVNVGSKRVQHDGGVDFDVNIRSDSGDSERLHIELRWTAIDPAQERQSSQLTGGSNGHSAENAGSATSNGTTEGHDEPAHSEVDLSKVLDSLSRERLYELAQKAELQGRSTMDKAQLASELVHSITVADLTRDDLALAARSMNHEVAQRDSRRDLIEKLSRAEPT